MHTTLFSFASSCQFHIVRFVDHTGPGFSKYFFRDRTRSFSHATHGTQRDRPDRVFQIICSDVLDMKETAHDGAKYIVTFIDAKSGYLRIDAMKRKAEVPIKWDRFHKHLNNRFPDLPVAKIRWNGAREYTSGDFKAYCDAASIEIDSGTPYTPKLNGITERKNRTIIEKVRALLAEGGGVETKYWPFAAKTAEKILNITPSKTTDEFTSPHHIVYKKPPDLTRLHPFGCIIMVHKPKEV